MSHFKHYLGKPIILALPGKNQCEGVLMDYGLDILVIYDGQQFLYIPVHQLHHFRPSPRTDVQMEHPQVPPLDTHSDKISLRNILNHAKGRFIQIYVTGGQPIHGYITSMLNNYFVFYSPVYQTMFVSLQHLKWLIPYAHNKTPYTLGLDRLPVHPTTYVLPRTFEEQVKKREGQMVVFDLGDHPNKVGLLQKTDQNMVGVVAGDGTTTYWNLQHLNIMHLP
ncbi:DUF2642 domain-containing protein [Brevibacillus humidisoli]|uniref:DUF2642 domain-containing protein n=1 Tax=Brevibacillus humidisoli TaxID=2895522 RepID=UPI001E60FFCD|nr:DUF2642 domain-containing protein [Brevibacillus humidisoli]UFJ42658.1 DUF2642 domain-containing protein [Brevibacillus humidisoli]